MGKVKLREAKQEDLRIVINWIGDEKSCRIWAGPGLRFPFIWDQFLEDIGYQTYDTFSLVDKTGKPIGIGQIMQRQNRLHLARILINPALHGKGFGRVLCEALINYGRKRHGNKAFSLNVYRHNKVARLLYEKLGFCEAPDQSQAATSDSVFMILDEAISPQEYED